MNSSPASTSGQFAHAALFYANQHEYLDGTIPFVQAGLAADEPVLVAVPGENLDHIRAALGAESARVRLHDMSVAGRNPGRIIPGVLLAFAAAHAGRPVRIIGEPIWAGRTATEYPACAQHEALINTAFAGRPATVLCPYDTAGLPPDWLDDAYRTHPVVQTADGLQPSPHYTDPLVTAARFNQPLSDPPGYATTVVVGLDALAAIRRFVAGQATAAGLPTDRVDDLTLAVSELAANTIEHTGGGGSLAMWQHDGQFICQLTDTGHITNPLAGRLPVPPRQVGGRGLLLVNQLCDLVRMHTRPGATSIRIYLRVRGAHGHYPV